LAQVTVSLPDELLVSIDREAARDVTAARATGASRVRRDAGDLVGWGLAVLPAEAASAP
jgi:hypothetical protein